MFEQYILVRIGTTEGNSTIRNQNFDDGGAKSSDRSRTETSKVDGLMRARERVREDSRGESCMR